MKIIKETLDDIVYVDLILSHMDIETLLGYFLIERDIKIGDATCSIAVRLQLESCDDEIEQVIEMEAKYHATNKEQIEESRFNEY